MPKGQSTRGRIVAQALKDASLVGLEGLSLGQVADKVRMSKSGLFAHFGSKEELQLQVLSLAAERFREVVIVPAVKAPRGIPRLQMLFDRWLAWERSETVPGGCVFIHASVELDDHPGPVRNAVAAWQRQWRDAMGKAAAIAVGERHFRTTLDTGEFAFRMSGIFLAYYHAKRLLADERAEALARSAFTSLLEWASP